MELPADFLSLGRGSVTHTTALFSKSLTLPEGVCRDFPDLSNTQECRL